MASMINSCLLFVLVLVTGCCSAPSRYASGFNVGGNTRLNLKAGFGGLLKADDGVITSDSHGILGADIRSNLYGGAYGAIDNNYYGTQGMLSSSLGASLEPRIHTEFGKDSKGNFRFEFQPSLGINTNGRLFGKGEFLTGDDAREYAQLYYGDSGYGQQYQQQQQQPQYYY